MTVYRSKLPDLAIPDVTIAELVLGGLAGREDRPALIDGPTGRAMTGAELTLQVKRFAGGLAARGIGPGQVVAIMAPNCPEFAVVFHGTSWAGATITTINPSYTAQELRHQLADSGAVLLIVPPALMAVARQAVEGTAVAGIVTLPGEGEAAADWDALLARPLDRPVRVDPATGVVALPYSSGTTGLAKGVMLTHRNLVANVLQIDAMARIQPGEITLGVLPFFHIYGMQAVMNLYLARGATVVTLPRFDLAVALELAARHRMQRLFVVPPVVLALAKHPLVDAHDLLALRMVISGAAPLGAELAAACAARLGCPVAQGYGMTEASPVTHFSSVELSRPGSAGALLPNTEAMLVDPETGAPCGPGEPGDLCLRGPQVMAGYLNNPAATARTVDAEGWLHSGDLARIDEDGYLFILDRVKELIKVKGFQVAPAELEGLLLAIPGISDCAVVGRPDHEAGEVPVAHVVRRPDSSLTEDEIKAALAGQVARYKALGAVVFTDAIPKSASGKILRRLLRDG